MRFAPFLIAAVLLLAPAGAMAQIGTPIDDPCPIPGLPCATNGIDDLIDYGKEDIFSILRVSFIGLLIFFFFMYSIRLLLESDEDSTVTDIKNAYAQGIVGAAIVSVATLIVDSFGRDAKDIVINPAPIEGAVGNVVLYLRLITGLAMGSLIVFQGVRLVLLQGQESEMEAQKKRFFHGLIGVVMVLLAGAIVEGVNPALGAQPSRIINQIIGISNYLLTLLSGVAVVAMVMAGIFMIFSNDDSGRDRAKRIIFATAVGIMIALTCWLIVRFFVA